VRGRRSAHGGQRRSRSRCGSSGSSPRRIEGATSRPRRPPFTTRAAVHSEGARVPPPSESWQRRRALGRGVVGAPRRVRPWAAASKDARGGGREAHRERSRWSVVSVGRLGRWPVPWLPQPPLGGCLADPPRRARPSFVCGQECAWCRAQRIFRAVAAAHWANSIGLGSPITDRGDGLDRPLSGFIGCGPAVLARTRHSLVPVRTSRHNGPAHVAADAQRRTASSGPLTRARGRRRALHDLVRPLVAFKGGVLWARGSIFIQSRVPWCCLAQYGGGHGTRCCAEPLRGRRPLPSN